VGLGLNTDLYQLTMAAGYFEAGKAHDRATFELSMRRLPHNRNFILAAGLQQAVDYLLNFRITAEEIAYLRKIPQFKYASGEFFEMLAGLRFTGDPMCPAARFETLRRELGPHFEAIEIDSRPGNPHGIKRAAHSVLTTDLVDAEGHPTRAALDRVLGLFRERLKTTA